MARLRVFGARKCANCNHGEGSHYKGNARKCHGRVCCPCPGFRAPGEVQSRPTRARNPGWAPTRKVVEIVDDGKPKTVLLKLSCGHTDRCPRWLQTIALQNGSRCKPCRDG